MFVLPGTLILSDAAAAVRLFEEALDQSSADKGTFTVDATALRSFDTSAIAVLLEARRLSQATGRAFMVEGAPATLIELSGLYGVDGLLGFAPAAAELHSTLA